MSPDEQKTDQKKRLPWSTIWSGLFLLPPFVFWLSLRVGFHGNALGLLRIWRVLPDFFYPYLIPLLPLPAIVLGVSSLLGFKKKTPVSVVGGILFTTLGIIFAVYAVGKAFFPPQ